MVAADDEPADASVWPALPGAVWQCDKTMTATQDTANAYQDDDNRFDTHYDQLFYLAEVGAQSQHKHPQATDLDNAAAYAAHVAAAPPSTPLELAVYADNMWISQSLRRRESLPSTTRAAIAQSTTHHRRRCVPENAAGLVRDAARLAVCVQFVQHLYTFS